MFAARDGARIRWKPGRIFQAELYADPSLVCEHEPGHWLLLAPPCNLYCAFYLPGYHILESWPGIQLHLGKDNSLVPCLTQVFPIKYH